MADNTSVADVADGARGGEPGVERVSQSRPAGRRSGFLRRSSLCHRLPSLPPFRGLGHLDSVYVSCPLSIQGPLGYKPCPHSYHRLPTRNWVRIDITSQFMVVTDCGRLWRPLPGEPLGQLFTSVWSLIGITIVLSAIQHGGAALKARERLQEHLFRLCPCLSEARSRGTSRRQSRRSMR